MSNKKLLARIEQELEFREIEKEIEPREEFTMIFSVPDAPDAPENPFPDPVCPLVYW